MANAAEQIQFHYLYKGFFFPDRLKVKTFLSKQMKKEGKEIDSINYIFCGDAYLLRMNQSYLNHDTLTDIITFELSPKGQPLLSDVYISIERVKENAIQFHSSFKDELLRVIFHGALHLIGYKDKSPADAKKMRVKENEFLQLFHVSRGTRTTRKD